jgi:hypothetical protein
LDEAFQALSPVLGAVQRMIDIPEELCVRQLVAPDNFTATRVVLKPDAAARCCRPAAVGVG